MTYEEALNFVYNVSWNGRDRGLARIRALLELMGNPQRGLRYIHVAGTNGKGSTSCMIDSILRKAGYHTGLYTSPYLLRFNERMRVDGLEISDEELIDNAMYVKGLVENMPEPPTFFETATALGFKFFRDHGVDAVVLEVGMGGRLDATNVIEDPVASVITAIGLDHTEYLGRTKARIAVEKAGIIKPGRPVVMGTNDREAIKGIYLGAYKLGSPVWRVRQTPEFLGMENGRQRFCYRGREYGSGLLGRHQMQNAATAIETAFLLRREGFCIPDGAIDSGIASAVWKGRFQPVLEGRMVVDGAHNPQGAASAASALRDYSPGVKPVALFGCLGDKNWRQALQMLMPCCSEFLVVPVQNPRACDPDAIREFILSRGGSARVLPSVQQGIDEALAAAERRGSYAFSVGSLYLASEVLTAIGETNSQI